MGVLFAANELENFDVIGSPSITGASARYRSEYARAGISIYRPNAIGVPIPPQSEFYFQTMFSLNLFYTIDSSHGAILFGNSDSNFLFKLSLLSQKLILANMDNSSVLGTSINTISSTTLFKLTMYIKSGVNGAFKLWINSNLEIDYTGDLSAGDASPDISYVKLSTPFLENSGSNAFITYSEVIAHTVNPADMFVKTLVPNGAGTHSDWSGVYTSIDEASANVADFVSADSADMRSTYNLTNLAADTLHVKHVTISAAASKGETGPQNLKLSIRSNGEDYDSDSMPLGDTLTRFSVKLPVNPVTGQAWTRDDINALEAGMVSVT